jgi:hypothetical protein
MLQVALTRQLSLLPRRQQACSCGWTYQLFWDMFSTTFYCFFCNVAGGLDAAGIPFTPAPAGMFLWVDVHTLRDMFCFVVCCSCNRLLVLLTPGS